MADRTGLHSILTSICPHVYFNPPETLKMEYPCIVYKLASIENRHADNIKYKTDISYDLTYISKTSDMYTALAISMLRYCRSGKPYVVDNLHHYPFTVYY